jgi:hypothetical protein
MASNLECIGLSAVDSNDFDALIASARSKATPLGRSGSLELLRWQDPSGIRLVLGFDGSELASFLPSFAGTSTTSLTNIRGLNDEVFAAAVVDEAGEQMTALALELEQQPLITRPIERALATITFLGRHVTLHADADAFTASGASLLKPDADPNEAPPKHFAERGLQWPIRMGHESFMSYGVFGEPSDSVAAARFAGVVLTAERRTVALTAQSFIVAQVNTVGIKASVCLKGSDFEAPPLPGQVIAGEVFIVGSLVDFEADRSQRRWLRGKSVQWLGRK